MCDLGIRARVVSLDPKKLDPSFAGRDFDRIFLADLPPEVDPCAERGEFHTVAYDGPPFRYKLSIDNGITVRRDGVVYTDVRLVGADASLGVMDDGAPPFECDDAEPPTAP
jgi:diphthamide synthase (EF-2-diphthine--ammonia ligase)